MRVGAVWAVPAGRWVPAWSGSGASAAVGSCRYDSSSHRVAGDVPFGAVYESVMMATQQDQVVEFGFAVMCVASLTELGFEARPIPGREWQVRVVTKVRHQLLIVPG
ncbi:MAG: hypothetical protein ACI8Y4_002806 [Candidatus Poriferisodalaceae bacterium]